MRHRIHTVFWIFILLVAIHTKANANPIDSLKSLIAQQGPDTSKAKLLVALGTAFFNSNLDSALHYWEEALALGEILEKSDDSLVRKVGKRQVMRSCSNTAVIFSYRGLYPLAIKQYQRCLRIAEELHDKRGTMIAMNNIGLIKMGQEKAKEALDQFERSQAIAMELKDSVVASTTLNNIGTALKLLKRFDEALAKFKESLLWSELLGNDDQIVDDLVNIGSIQLHYDQFDSALVTFERSLALANELEYNLGMPAILLGISGSYSGLAQPQKALLYAQASLDSARSLEFTEEIVDALEEVAKAQRVLGQHQLANKTLLEYIALKDSLFNQEKATEVGQLEESFDYERKEYEEVLQAEKEATALKIKNFRQYLISFGTACVIALLLLFGVRYARQSRLRYFVVFGALLFFFEFALVLLDNFVDGFTGGLPIPKLLANVLLAAVFAPLNIVIERSLMKGKGKIEN